MPFQGALSEIRSVVRDRSVVRCGVRPVPAPLLDGGAEPRPAGGTPRRVDGCRRGRLEHPAGFYYAALPGFQDRKSTRLNSSHGYISYAVFCLKKKKKTGNTFHFARTRSC